MSSSAPGTPRTAVRAAARITAAPDGRGGTALPLLAGEGPLALRRIRGRGGGEARVCLVGAMAAPLAGDRLRIDVRVEAGAALYVTSAAATIALPGRTDLPASYDITITVGEGAELRWLPEPLISAYGSSLRVTVRAELAPTARLVLREEQILGRSGEGPGRLTSRLAVSRGGRPLLEQSADYGPGAPGWDGPAVLAGSRAAGQLLLVDPGLADKPPAPRVLAAGEAAVVPLPGPGVLTTAVARDAARLRALLDEGLVRSRRPDATGATSATGATGATG